MAVEHAYAMGLIGDGVLPSLTPAMQMAEARAHGLALVYRPLALDALGLTPDALPDMLDWAERLGFDALNITHPCKIAVIPLLDRLDETAAAVGAVNTVRFTPEGRIGSNTDTTGFERAMREGLPGARTERVVQVGAGGAGSAVADALLRLGARELSIIDVDAERATALVNELSARHGAHVTGGTPDQLPARLAAADGVVQCTPIGMHQHPGLPFDPALLRETHWVADIVYRPLDTALLAAARERGCRTLNGGRMAVGQAADTFRLVTGLEPDIERMHQHFQGLIEDEGADHTTKERS